ncbi:MULTISPECIES: MFS transporter [Rhodomicrobium]|uniref:MFS transporter n=1 Tax=Rhodomicrobium TaxID=1068 RepID=UPI000B4B4905|nr:MULTISPECIES: MFS transporter [Rhodomicrobium]
MTAASETLPGPSRPARSDRWFITALGIGQICSWGTLYYSFPQLAQAMERDLGWSKPELYGAATLGLALSGLAAYPVGAAIDRGHGRAVMGAASILAGLLMLAWSQVESLALFYVLFAGIGCLQAATLYEPAFAVVARRVGPDQARRGITALTLWGGFASTVFIPLIQILIDQVGWRGALVGLGLVNIILCGGLYYGAIRPSQDAIPRPSPRTDASPAGDRGALHQALRTPVFWALALAFTAYTASYSAFTFHFYPLLIERGLDATATVAVLSCIGPAQVAGRVLIWLFAPHASIRRIGSLVVVSFPIAIIAILLLPPDFAGMAAVAVIYGAGNGIMTIVRGMAVLDMLSRRAYGAINGALSGPSLIARAAAPAGAAALWAATQNYDGVLLAIFAGAVITAIGFWVAAALSMTRPVSLE